MIPQALYNPGLANDLKNWLIQQLRQTMSDRGPLEDQWIRWEKIYRARPRWEKKDFPFENASNLVVPVAATDIDTLYARMMGMLMEPRSLWSVEALRPELMDAAVAINDFLEWAQHNELSLYEPLGSWLIDVHKLGTGLLKQRYTREMKKVFEWRELQQGTFQQQAVILLKDHPDVGHVHLQDFYIPAGFRHLADAPWCAERVRMTWQQFMNRVKAGIYNNAQQIGAWYFSPPINRVQQELDKISNYRPAINQQLEFYEFWLDFDIDGDGWDEAVLCTIHLESQTYVRLDFNPFFNQDKPYSAANFMRDVNSFYGIGMCEMTDHFQEEITAMHNQRIDNGTVQNSQIFAISKDNTNIKANEKIYPGKIFRLNNARQDIVALNMGAGNGIASSMEIEQSTRAESQKRTGVNDWVQANATPAVGYGTAYTTQQMMANTSMRFGETLRNVREALSETGTRVLELYQQFNQRGKPIVVQGQEQGRLTEIILQFPLDLIRRGMRVSVTAIDIQNSRDAQIRTNTIVMQQLSQFYMQYMQMLSYAANPQMPPPIRQTALTAAEGSSILMRRLLELYGEHDTSQILPELQGGLNVQQQQLTDLAAVLQSAQPGAGGGVQGSPPPSGMGAFPPSGMGGPGGAPGLPAPPSAGAAPNPSSAGGSQYGF